MTDQQRTAADRLAAAMHAGRSGAMKPDEYRALVREMRPAFTFEQWQGVQFAAAAKDSRS